MAFGTASPAYAQEPAPNPAPVPEACANIQDEAAKQECANASEANDPNANAGTVEGSPTQGGVSSAESTGAGEGEIVVTGSRLRRDERTSADPLTVIDPSADAREGEFETAEVLQTSPVAAGSTQITSALSTNFVVNGGEGVQTISLRGLGANRTLVLLNGRRAGPAGVRGGVSAFDLNVIPTEAIQSIEILKTGASSIYGSDAVAGVVNLITKKDIRGLQLRSFGSPTEETGGDQYSVAAAYGLGIGDRGHLMFGADYYRRNELEQGDRSYFDCIEENVTNPDGQPVGPIDPRTGQPYCTNIFANAIALTNFSPLFGGGNNLRRRPFPGAPFRAITTIQYDPTLGQYLLPLDPAANPLQFTAPAGFFPVGSYSATALALTNGYDPRVASDSVIPKTDRVTLFAESGYELSDTLDLYVEGLFNRRKTRTDSSRQLFPTQFTGNSFLPYFFCDGTTCDPFAAGDPMNTEFSGAQLLTPIVRAPFDSSTDVKYYRGVAGIRADLDSFLPNGFADLHFQHSRSDGDYQRTIIFRDAVEFGVAEFRTERCAGTLTAIRGVPCMDIDYTDPRVLAGNFTPEEYAFLFGEDKGNTLYKQNSVEMVVGGDAFSLPAGEVKVALGAHWRRDSIRDVPGEHTLSDNLWGSTTSGITAGHQRTLEGFGEIEIPVLRDLPGLREVTLNGAARITSTYARRADGEDDADKGNWTYKIAANFQTTDWLRLRGTYGTSFRSPALFEQFLADESGFLGQGLDPCRLLDQRLAAGQVTPQVYENCISQGIPTNHPGVGTSLESFSGGGVGVLDPETSKALTVSAIFTPQGWLWSGGRFSLAIDYIDIDVQNQVTQLGAANILSGCYASADFPNDPLCSLFVRDLNPNSPRAFQILTVRDPYINIDQQHNVSVDFTGRFRQDMGGWGTLSLLGQASYQLKDKFTLFRGLVDNFNGEVGDPKYVADLNVSWAKNPFTITYGLDVIGPTNDLQDLRRSFGSSVTANNCLLTAAGIALRGGEYCPTYKLPRVMYHSLSAEIQANEQFSFLFGLANMFDKKPPAVSTVASPISAFGQTPLLGSYYDYLGRRFFVSARAKLRDFSLGF